MPREHFAHFSFSGHRHVVALEPIRAGHQDTCRAEPTLEGMMPFKGHLQVSQRMLIACQSLDCVNPPPGTLHRQGETGALRDAINSDSTGTAHAMLATHMGSRRTEAMAQKVS
jgi:hypothetical protein